MSGTIFGSRIRSSVSTFAVAALLAAAPALAVGSASAATVEPTAPPAATAPAPKAEKKAETGATKAEAQTAPTASSTASPTAAAPAKPSQVQIATTPKAEVTKAQADAVAKELGAKPTDSLTVQLGQYHEKIEAANALKDSTARAKAVTEAHQQLTAIGGKPVTPEQIAKIDGILGVKSTPSTVQ